MSKWCIRVDAARDIATETDSMARALACRNAYVSLSGGFRANQVELFYTIYDTEADKFRVYDDKRLVNIADEINAELNNIIIDEDNIYIAGRIEKNRVTLCDRLVVYDSSKVKDPKVLRDQVERDIAATIFATGTGKNYFKSKVLWVSKIDCITSTIIEKSTHGGWLLVSNKGKKFSVPDRIVAFSRRTNLSSSRTPYNEHQDIGINFNFTDSLYHQNWNYLPVKLKGLADLKVSVPITDNKYFDGREESEDIAKDLMGVDYEIDNNHRIYVNPDNDNVEVLIQGIDDAKVVSNSVNVKTLRFGKGVYKIQSHAFENCIGVREIILGPDVREIRFAAFSAANAAKIDFSAATKLYSLGNAAFGTIKTNTLDLSMCTQLKSLTKDFIHNGSKIDTMILPESIEVLERWFIEGSEIGTLDMSLCTLFEFTQGYIIYNSKINKLILPKYMPELYSGLFNSGTEIHALVLPDNVDRVKGEVVKTAHIDEMWYKPGNKELALEVKEKFRCYEAILREI